MNELKALIFFMTFLFLNVVNYLKNKNYTTKKHNFLCSRITV